MDQKEIKKLWKKHGLETRKSYYPKYIKGLCKEFEVEFDKNVIYRKSRYREISPNVLRVDGEDFLMQICKKHNIIPNKDKLDLANRMYGEGSRRRLVQEAYLGA